MELHERLKFLRDKARYTQQYVAEAIGVDYTTYGKYEAGKTPIKLDQAKKISDIYGISLDELYSGEEPTRKEDIAREAEAIYKRHIKRNISVMVELDGLPQTLQDWIDKLTKINQMVAK